MMAIVVAELLAKLTLDKGNFDRNMKDAKSKFMGLDTSISGIKRSWGEFLGAAQMASLPIAGAMAKGISDAMAFDSALAQITARTGVTGDGLAQVRDLAIQMGRETKFSAQDAANAMLELLSSGDDITTAMGRLPQVLDLAAAGSLDLKTAADGLTDVMAAFGLEAKDSTDVVQSLFAASASSSATVQDLIDGFANVGPVARNFGLNVDDAAAFLAVLAENGIKGSEAGTALKSALLNMSRTTEETQGAWEQLGVSLFDAQGNTRDLNTVLLELDKALDTRTPEEQNELMKALGGSYGIVALSALRASGGITDMQGAMDGAAGAGNVAKASMETFEGRLQSLQGSIETLNVVAFTPFMNNVLKPIVSDFQGVIDKVTLFAEKNPELTQTILTLAGAFVIGTGAITALGMGVKLVTTAVVALLTTALSPLGFALATGAILVGAYLGNWMGFRDYVDNTLRPAILKIIDDFKIWFQVIQDIQTILDGLMSGKYDVGQVVEAAGSALGGELNIGLPNARQNVEQNTAEILTNPDPLGAWWSMTGATLNPVGTLFNMAFPDQDPFAHLLNRASGGGVNAGQMYRVNEDGVEHFRPDGPGEVIPLGDPRGNQGAAPIINIYGARGQDEHTLAQEVSRELVKMGYRRSA